LFCRLGRRSLPATVISQDKRHKLHRQETFQQSFDRCLGSQALASAVLFPRYPPHLKNLPWDYTPGGANRLSP
jgi:hypothetical protein